MTEPIRVSTINAGTKMEVAISDAVQSNVATLFCTGATSYNLDNLQSSPGIAFAATGTILTATAQSATDVPLTLTGASAQSGDFLDVKNSSATILAKIASDGGIFSKNGTAAAPGNSFITYNTTGMYATGAANLGFSVGGTLKFDYGITTASTWTAAAVLVATTVYSNVATFVVGSKTTLTTGAGVGAGTLTNAPAAGNPTKWIGIDDNGTTRYVPAW